MTPILDFVLDSTTSTPRGMISDQPKTLAKTQLFQYFL